jgi:hypothetical protein
MMMDFYLIIVSARCHIWSHFPRCMEDRASSHCFEGLVDEAAFAANIVLAVIVEPLSIDPKRIVARTNDDK